MIVRSRLRRITATFGLATAALALSAPASAAPLKFTFAGITNGSFLIDSDPAPIGFDKISFTVNYTGGTGDFPGLAQVVFSDPDVSGGFNLSTAPADFRGTILYSGPSLAPHLLTGTFSLDSGATTLTVGPGAPAPELATGLLATLAAFGALALTRRRQPA